MVPNEEHILSETCSSSEGGGRAVSSTVSVLGNVLGPI